jgi:dihydrolipoamide dehydrogenase
MGIDIIVPKAGLTMTEATVATWLVSEGDHVEKDQVIADLMTEKMTVEVLAPEDGIISSIVVQETEEVQVGATLATLNTKSENNKDQDNVNRKEITKVPQSEVSSTNNVSDFSNYDVAIIGSGPGGYVAAIRIAQLGGKAIVIERNELGGVCLNSGCIPTKTLLKGAELSKLHKLSKEYGIFYSPPKIDYSKLIERKDLIVEQLKEGIAHLLKKNKVTILKGTGRVIAPHKVEVTNNDGEIESIICEHIILATGSEVQFPPIPGLVEAKPMTNKEALLRQQLPESIAIIGGGAIGCEFAGIYAPLGVKVVLIESEKEVLPGTDKDIAQFLRKSLEKDGVEFLNSSRVQEIKVENDNKILLLEQNQVLQEIVVKEILVATGRKANLDYLQHLGLEVNDGKVKLDEYLRTSEPSIFAIGDLTGVENLAHVASAQGIVAAENCMGYESKMNYQFIPRCIYTSPEIASVGLSESEAKEKGLEFQTGKHYFNANGRALTNGKAEGFIKVLRGKKYNEILGVHIVGSNASELISEAVLALNLEATTEELIATIHPHPTLSEGLLEATLDSMGKGIHV